MFDITTIIFLILIIMLEDEAEKMPMSNKVTLHLIKNNLYIEIFCHPCILFLVPYKATFSTYALTHTDHYNKKQYC